jgi:hypothetical protein
MYINELKEWVKTYNIVERTKKGFFTWLNNFKLEEPEEYYNVMENIESKELILELHTISLNLGNWPECTYNTVSASMRVFYKDKRLFNYESLYLLNGEDEDDFVDFL